MTEVERLSVFTDPDRTLNLVEVGREECSAYPELGLWESGEAIHFLRSVGLNATPRWLAHQITRDKIATKTINGAAAWSNAQVAYMAMRLYELRRFLPDAHTPKPPMEVHEHDHDAAAV